VQNSKVLISNFDYTASDGSLCKQNYEFGEIDANGNVNTSKNTGNIAKLTNSFNGLAQPFVQTFKYDSLNRVTEAKELNNGTTTWQQGWNYDRFGNRTSFNSQAIGQTAITTTPNIDQNTNRFVSGVQYDKTGNVVQDVVNGQVRNFVFNGDNKQVHVKDANNTPIGTYYYDGNGARVKKVTAAETTIFVYDVSSKLVAEYSTATPPTNPTISYTATDTLGSPRVITDQQGNVTSRRGFLPFGEELNPDVNFRKTAFKYGYGSDNVRKRFTGYEKDQETQLDYAQARYYNNIHGRFTAVDPLLASGKSGNPQSFNRYAYTMNQPLILTDKTGLQTDETDDVIHVDTYWNNAKNALGSFGDYLLSLGQTQRTLEYNTGGEQNFDRRIGSSRVARDATTILNPTTSPAFKGFNRRVENTEKYTDFVPLLGSGSKLAKSIWLGGNGSNNKLEVLGNGAGVGFDFATSFGGFGSVSKQAPRAIALGLERTGSRMVLSELAEQTGAATFKEWAPDLT
jgi:RHS repeat-associated protein